jgi:hypothetical protein
MRVGDRVRLVKSYEQVGEPPVGAEGFVSFKWPDGMLAVAFDDYDQEFGYRPPDLARGTATVSNARRALSVGRSRG